MAEIAEKCIAEFVGTFLLVFTVGCNVIAGDPTWGVTSIAAVLMVCIYALGGVSGGHFNPCVTLALGLSEKIQAESPWKEVAIYCATQLVAGLVAGLCFVFTLGQSHNLAPAKGFGWIEAGLAETLYTAVLCFVVLNCAASKKSGCDTGNQFYGLAIGFVVIAGGYGAGSISGGCFNPAVAMGLDVSSALKGFGWGPAYVAFEVLGAVLAWGLFRMVRPDDFDESVKEYDLPTKCASEFIGTFVLVLTVGMNVSGGSKAGAWSIAASLMCMVYSLGSCSGAHFNPAVTVAILLSGRNKTNPQEAGAFILTQLLAGVVAAWTNVGMHHWQGFKLGPKEPYTWGPVLEGELIFTFVLCFVVLNVATVSDWNKKTTNLDQNFGLAIGSCVTAGGLAMGKVSGGVLNPAIAVGIASTTRPFGWTEFNAGFGYCLVQLLGGAAASALLFAMRPTEYAKSAAKRRQLRMPGPLP